MFKICLNYGIQITIDGPTKNGGESKPIQLEACNLDPHRNEIQRTPRMSMICSSHQNHRNEKTCSITLQFPDGCWVPYVLKNPPIWAGPICSRSGALPKYDSHGVGMISISSQYITSIWAKDRYNSEPLSILVCHHFFNQNCNFCRF